MILASNFAGKILYLSSISCIFLSSSRALWDIGIPGVPNAFIVTLISASCKSVIFFVGLRDREGEEGAFEEDAVLEREAPDCCPNVGMTPKERGGLGVASGSSEGGGLVRWLRLGGDSEVSCWSVFRALRPRIAGCLLGLGPFITLPGISFSLGRFVRSCLIEVLVACVRVSLFRFVSLFALGELSYL